MATVTGYTAQRMKQIEDTTIVDGDVVDDHLILMSRDGETTDAGNVRGPKGDQGIPGYTSIIVCTSTTRPSGAQLFNGLVIYETDTEKMYSYNGFGWRPVNQFIDVAANAPVYRIPGTYVFVNDANLPVGAVVPDGSRPVTPGFYQWISSASKWQPQWNLPWGYMGIKKLSVAQSSITTAVDVTGLTLTMTAIAGRQLEIRADLPMLSSVDGDFARIDICDQAGAIKDGRQFRMSTSGVGTVTSEWVATTTGTLTRKVQASRSAGSGNIQVACGGTTIGKFMIIDHGPAAVAS